MLLEQQEVRNKILTFVKSKILSSRFELNESQKEAVVQAMTQDFLLITGSPGTCKTTLLAEIVKNFLHQYVGCRILAVSQSNAAADVFTERLISNGMKPVRICSKPVKYLPSVMHEVTAESFALKRNK